MILLSFFIFVVLNSFFSQNLKSFLSCLILMVFMFYSNFEHWSITTTLMNLSLDWLAWTLSSLTLIITSLTFLVIQKLSFEQASSLQKLNALMNFTILLVFTSTSCLSFYFMFELSIIPIAMMILGWGYQPERLQAMMAMALYTMICSLPLLVMIMIFSNNFNSFFMTLFLTLGNTNLIQTGVHWALILGMLVKFPMFFIHLWLPKAHVEAPVVGSMVLAALLLKLAGFGLWRLSFSLFLTQNLSVIQSIALLGGGLVGVLCLRQMDMKIMIAYSSVSHMSLVVALMLAFSKTAFLAAMMIMFAHGIASSAMFASANFIYNKFHSRNLTLMNGLLSYWPKFTSLWFLACVGNMGTPPTINFFSEMWALSFLVNDNIWFMAPLSMVTFFAVAFTLTIYASSVQGQPSSASHLNMIESQDMMICLIPHIWFLFMALMFFN